MLQRFFGRGGKNEGPWGDTPPMSNPANEGPGVTVSMSIL